MWCFVSTENRRNPLRGSQISAMLVMRHTVLIYSVPGAACMTDEKCRTVRQQAVTLRNLCQQDHKI